MTDYSAIIAKHIFLKNSILEKLSIYNYLDVF